jgi:hypothetical protein
MEKLPLSKFYKRYLLIGLFIVPFFIGMALIFMGKGIGTLPKLHAIDVKKKIYYTVPEFEVTNLLGQQKFKFSQLDSSIFVVTLHPISNQFNWEKHLMYLTKVIERYNNTKVLTILEGDTAQFNWTENPEPFIKKFPKWMVTYTNTGNFEKIKNYFKTEVDTTNGLPPYIIVDKEKIIRAYCKINDLKTARDVPKMLKILNNQYAPRNNKVEKNPNL